MIESRALIKLNRSLDKIGKELNKAAMKIPGEVSKKLLEGANLIRNEILTSMARGDKTGKYYYKGKNVSPHRASAPGESPAVDTGELIRSIMFDVDEMKMEVGAEAGAPYAEYLETGTDKMKPRPWLEPATDKYEEQIIQGIAEAGFNVIRDAVEGAIK